MPFFAFAASTGYGTRPSSRRSKEPTFQRTTELPFVPSITAEFETCPSANRRADPRYQGASIWVPLIPRAGHTIQRTGSHSALRGSGWNRARQNYGGWQLTGEQADRRDQPAFSSKSRRSPEEAYTAVEWPRYDAMILRPIF